MHKFASTSQFLSMEFQDNKSNAEEENLEDMLEDIGLSEDPNYSNFVKKDNTIFVVDCSPQIMTPLPGEKQSQFEKIMDSYANFLMSKIIANCQDRVGLIFYNVNKKSNSLNFEGIFTVHQLDFPSAKIIKSVKKIKSDFELLYGHSDTKISLHQVLWLYGQEIKDCQAFKNYLRMFLFTADDCPHEQGDERREQAINHARQLSAKSVHIQLFPVRSRQRSKFDMRKFYQEIISFDSEDLNAQTLDNSSKIMDLQERIRQKEFKKRTLNRLQMQVGTDAFVGIKIYAVFSKARKANCKKLQASSNKPLKRVVKRLNNKGDVLYNEQIGTYYPLGGERIKISKEDMIKIKTLKDPGISLIGFKPKKLIKPYHNLRPSYFLYPDEEHISGSTQFIDALIQELSERQQVAIVSIMPRINQELRFGALFPQRESYDVEDHHQTPPGFNLIILPFSDDIVNFGTSQKTVIKPSKVSTQLLRVTKLLINNLTVRDFDFRDFQNPSLQKFYSHLQAHALNQKVVESKADTLMPDEEGFKKFSDIIDMVQETADIEVGAEEPELKKGRRPKKEQKKQKKEDDPTVAGMTKNPTKRSRVQQQSSSKTGKKQAKKEVKIEDTKILQKVQNCIEDNCARILRMQELIVYLKQKKLSQEGEKSQLVDRIMAYISFAFDQNR